MISDFLNENRFFTDLDAAWATDGLRWDWMD